MLRFLLKQVTRLLSPIAAAGYSRIALGVHDGIGLVDVSRRKDLKQDFVQAVVQALELIRTRDPRRYRRAKQELRFIIHQELVGATGSYHSHPPSCVIDYSRFRRSDAKASATLRLAAVIVHEATHGLLIHRGIAFSAKNRIRVERFCHLEESRFVSHVDPRLGSAWFQDHFRPQVHTSLWTLYRSPVRYWRTFFKRRSVSQRASNEAVHRMGASPSVSCTKPKSVAAGSHR